MEITHALPIMYSMNGAVDFSARAHTYNSLTLSAVIEMTRTQVLVYNNIIAVKVIDVRSCFNKHKPRCGR